MLRSFLRYHGIVSNNNHWLNNKDSDFFGLALFFSLFFSLCFARRMARRTANGAANVARYISSPFAVAFQCPLTLSRILVSSSLKYGLSQLININSNYYIFFCIIIVIMEVVGLLEYIIYVWEKIDNDIGTFNAYVMMYALI